MHYKRILLKLSGEALMGVLIAVVAAFIMPLPATMAFGGVLGAAAFVAVAIYLYRGVAKS